MAIPSILPFSSTVAAPTCSSPHPIISADITPRQHVCGEVREREGRCIIEQCQWLRLETAECGCSTGARRGVSKDRKVISH